MAKILILIRLPVSKFSVKITKCYFFLKWGEPLFPVTGFYHIHDVVA